LKVINCLINTTYDPNDVNKCFNNSKLDYNRYRRCMLSDADNILAKYGERTDENIPKVTFVPLVKINDYFNMTLDEDATSKLTETVCKILQFQPEECIDYKDIV